MGMGPLNHAIYALESLNWLAVIVAALAGYFPGALWYSKIGFLRPWARELGIDIDAKPGKGPGAKVAVGLIPAFAAATTMALLVHGTLPIHRGLTLGLAIGGGFVSTSFAIQYLYENRSWKFWAINAGYHVLQYLIMGVVFALMT
jgi:hypothetical protein